jgi:hypothetical protein
MAYRGYHVDQILGIRDRILAQGEPMAAFCLRWVPDRIPQRASGESLRGFAVVDANGSNAAIDVKADTCTHAEAIAKLIADRLGTWFRWPGPTSP